MNQMNRSSRDLELNSNCKRAIKTTMIGALSRFEKSFGYLWGHGKSEAKGDKLTDHEKIFLELWLKLREEVLDCGNEQSRIVDKEFDKFIVRFNGYQYKFKVRQPSPQDYQSYQNKCNTGDKNGNV